MSSQPSGSTTTISRVGQASAMPDASPPPPQGMTIRGGGSRRAARGSRGPTVPCPATIAGIVETGHHDRAALGGQARGDVFAAFGPPVVEDDLGALGPRAVDLHLRGVGRHHDHRRGCRAAAPRWRLRGHDCPTRKRRRRASRSSVVSCSRRLVAPRSLKRRRSAGTRISATRGRRAPRSRSAASVRPVPQSARRAPPRRCA